ncbi:type IV conjugative transfer system lipoprotein TraV [Nitrosomonas mobilis]|uniref:Membrane lipoprotein lipid attachment site n=1 Tax=Nitrosomonas mobilis TaxID=51642 RepID=A0A1G5SD08_9PROT|nr:type IV conjugative transfer system lipoprotein TraV [Nitrosomonas mobilis]SCZ85032.1 Membrane lipoprotein lipid attachment site [Nitrosomonas mobilis]
MIKPFFSIALLLILGGCTTLSGYDGGSKFACKAPDGVSCSSMSGVYANAVQNNLPVLGKKGNPDNPPASRSNKDSKADDSYHPAGVEAQATSTIIGNAPRSGDPILIKPKLLRVWLAPWEDADGDLHDQSYIYMLADYGRWIIEHNRQRIIDEYRPTSLVSGRSPKDMDSEDSARTAGVRPFAPLPQPPQPTQYSAPPPSVPQQNTPLSQDDIYPEDRF